MTVERPRQARDLIVERRLSGARPSIILGLRGEGAPASSSNGAVLTQQLPYATFIGGSSSEVLTDLAYTPDERLILTGRTASLDFPLSEDAFDDELLGILDGVVLVMSADGTELVHATLLGGDAFDSTDFVDIAPNGDLVISGSTSSPDFPVTPGAFDDSPNGGPTDLFVVRLSSDAKTLIASTYLGGSSDIDQIRALGIHPVDGSILIAGRTCSADWPTTPGALSTSRNGVCDLCFTRLTPQLDDVIASTYWGGFDADALLAAEFLDDGSVVFLAATGFDPWPVTLPDGAFAGATSDNRPLVRLSDAFDATLWSSHVDATFDAIRQKPDGSLVLIGSTGSVDYPTTPGAFAEVSVSPPDFVATSITPDGTTLLWSTFIPGTFIQSDITDAAIDDDGNVVFCGFLGTSDYPFTPDAIDTEPSLLGEGMVTVVDATGSDVLYASLLGGDAGNSAANVYGLALHPCAGVMVLLSASSPAFPTTPDAYDPTHNGAIDAWLVRVTTDNPWLDLGQALLGTQGRPKLRPQGTLCGGDPTVLEVTDARPGGTAFLVVGVSELSAPFKGGTLVPSPDIVASGLPLDAAGTLAVDFTWPPGVPPGLSLLYQAWIPDPVGPFGFAASNAIEGTTP